MSYADERIRFLTGQIEALEKKNAELLAALETVLNEVDGLQCACTLSERDSGHLVDCNMPAIYVALDTARATIKGREA